MNGTTFGQYIPQESAVHSLDPRTKIFLVVVLMIATMMIDSYLGGLIIALFTGTIMLAARIDPGWYWKGSRPLLILIFITAAFQIFLTPGQVLARWWIVTITLPGLKIGLLMAYRLLMLYLLAQLLTRTTSPMQLADGMEMILKPLKRLGLPVHETAMIMMIALRFIPVFFEEAEKVIQAQQSRGAELEGASFSQVRNMVSIMVPLFLRAFRRADELAVAMEVRCYSGGEGRTRLHEIQMKNADYLVMLLTTGLAFLATIL